VVSKFARNLKIWVQESRGHRSLISVRKPKVRSITSHHILGPSSTKHSSPQRILVSRATMDEPCKDIQPNHKTKLQLVLPTLFARSRVAKQQWWWWSFYIGCPRAWKTSTKQTLIVWLFFSHAKKRVTLPAPQFSTWIDRKESSKFSSQSTCTTINRQIS
jgi:hypothetical protein